MEKSEKYNRFYMTLAQECAKMSHAIRKRVGCSIVRDGNILAMGWNGTPAGTDNSCEDRNYWDGSPETAGFTKEQFLEFYPYNDYDKKGPYSLVTKASVSHAEENALAKIMRSNISSVGSTAYVTLEPCIHCAKLLFNAGIIAVYYNESYRDHSGIEYLRSLNVTVIKL